MPSLVRSSLTPSVVQVVRFRCVCDLGGDEVRTYSWGSFIYGVDGACRLDGEGGGVVSSIASPKRLLRPKTKSAKSLLWVL